MSKPITVVGSSTCEYVKALKANLLKTPSRNIEFKFVECDTPERKTCDAAEDGRACERPSQCGYFTENNVCDHPPSEKSRMQQCEVRGYPSFRNGSGEICHLGYEPSRHDGFIQKINDKCWKN